MAHYPVDSGDWRRTLDGIVAATDTNLRAIRGLSASGASRGASPAPASPNNHPATPPAGTPTYQPSQETIFNSAVLGKIQDRQLHSARGELGALLGSVQSSLSELRIEVSAAKKMSNSAIAAAADGARHGAARYGGAHMDSRLDSLEDQIARLHKSIRQTSCADPAPLGGVRNLSPALGADDQSLEKVQKKCKSLDKKVEHLASSYDKLKDHVAQASSTASAMGVLSLAARTKGVDVLEHQMAALRSAHSELEDKVYRHIGANADGIDRKVREQMLELLSDRITHSEQTMQRKLQELAQAVLEEYQEGDQKRLIEALKTGLQDAAVKIDGMEDRLIDLQSNKDLDAPSMGRLDGFEARLDEVEGLTPAALEAVMGRLKTLEGESATRAALQGRLVAVEMKAAQAEQKATAAEEKAAAAEARASELDLEELNARLERLQSDLEAQRQAKAAIPPQESANESVAELELRVKLAEEKISHVEGLEERLSTAEGAATQSNEFIESLQQDRDSLLQALAQLEDSHQAILGRLDASEIGQPGSISDSVAEHLSELASQVEEMAGLAAEHSQGIAAIQIQQQTFVAADEVTASLEELEAKLSLELEKTLKTIDGLEARLASTEGQVAALEDKTENALRAVQSPQADKHHKKPAKALNLENLEAKLNAMGDGVLVMEAETTNLGKRIDGLQAEQTRAMDANAHKVLMERLDRLESNQADSMDVDEDASSSTVELSNRVAALERNTATLDAAHGALEHLLDQKDNGSRGQGDELKAAIAELWDATNSLEFKVATLGDPTAACAVPASANQLDDQRIEQALAAVAKLETQGSSLEEHISASKTREAELQNRLEHLAEQIRSFQGSVLQARDGDGDSAADTSGDMLMAIGTSVSREEAASLHSRIEAVEGKLQAVVASAPVARDGPGLFLGPELAAELENFKVETRSALEDVEITVSGAKRAAMQAESAAGEAQEGMEEMVGTVREIQATLEALKAGRDLPAGGPAATQDMQAKVQELEALHLSHMDVLTSEMEAIKASIIGLEAGEATRAFGPLTPEDSAPTDSDRAQARLSEVLQRAEEAKRTIRTAQSSVSRDAKCAGLAAAQAEAAANALSRALPEISSALAGLGPELGQVQEALALSQQQTDAALTMLHEQLAQVREEALAHLADLRTDSEAAVEALADLNVANAAAQHSVMQDHFLALQLAEERAVELEVELAGAHKQVESLSQVLQTVELGGLPGESRSAHYSRQMAYMIGLLQRKAQEAASLRAAQDSSSPTGPKGYAMDTEAEVEALQKAFGQESVGAWTAIEEFRDTIMHFETEMQAALGQTQEELAGLRRQVEEVQAYEDRPPSPSLSTPGSASCQVRSVSLQASPTISSPQLSVDVDSIRNPMFTPSAEEHPSLCGLNSAHENLLYSDGSMKASGDAEQLLYQVQAQEEAAGDLNKEAMQAAESSLARSQGSDSPRADGITDQQDSFEVGQTAVPESLLTECKPSDPISHQHQPSAGPSGKLEDTALESSIATEPTLDTTGVTAYAAEAITDGNEATRLKIISADSGGADEEGDGTFGQMEVAATGDTSHYGVDISHLSDAEEDTELPVTPPAAVGGQVFDSPQHQGAPISEGSASTSGTESIATDIYTEDEDFVSEDEPEANDNAKAAGAESESEAAAEQVQPAAGFEASAEAPAQDRPDSAEPVAVLAGDTSGVESLQSVSVKDRLRMFGGHSAASPLSGRDSLSATTPRRSSTDGSSLPEGSLSKSGPIRSSTLVPPEEDRTESPVQARIRALQAAAAGTSQSPPLTPTSSGRPPKPFKSEAGTPSIGLWGELTPLRTQVSGIGDILDEAGSLSSKGLLFEVAESAEPDEGEDVTLPTQKLNFGVEDNGSGSEGSRSDSASSPVSAADNVIGDDDDSSDDDVIVPGTADESRVESVAIFDQRPNDEAESAQAAMEPTESGVQPVPHQSDDQDEEGLFGAEDLVGSDGLDGTVVASSEDNTTEIDYVDSDTEIVRFAVPGSQDSPTTAAASPSWPPRTSRRTISVSASGAGADAGGAGADMPADDSDFGGDAIEIDSGDGETEIIRNVAPGSGDGGASAVAPSRPVTGADARGVGADDMPADDSDLSDDAIEIDYGDGETEIVRGNAPGNDDGGAAAVAPSRPATTAVGAGAGVPDDSDPSDDAIEIDYGDREIEVVHNGAAEDVEGESEASADELGPISVDDHDDSIHIDYGDVEDPGLDYDDYDLNDLDKSDLETDRDDLPADLGTADFGESLEGEEDSLVMSGELDLANKLFDEMENLQAQLRDRALDDFQRETVELRLLEIQDELAELEATQDGDLEAEVEPNTPEEMEILGQIQKKQQELATVDEFDQEFIELEIDDLKLELRQLRTHR